MRSGPALAALGLLLALGCGKPAPPSPAPPRAATPVECAIAFLFGQGEDGLWRSKTHSELASGQALTPFVLYALSHARPDELAPYRPVLERALGRLPIRGGEYPTYSLALSLLALGRLGGKADRGALAAELRGLQLSEALGWGPGDPEYGSWDDGVLLPRRPQCQRPSLSVTALACEALGADPGARRFAERCRAHDGGFFFTPSLLWSHANKLGSGVSYESATCDALRILGPDERASSWLLASPRSAGPGLAFYGFYARAKCRPSPELGAQIRALQAPDGSFRNPDGQMKEDDPVLATGLALVAMALCR